MKLTASHRFDTELYYPPWTSTFGIVRTDRILISESHMETVTPV